MEVFIDDKELIKLYTSGHNRKLKLRPEIVEKFFASLQKIEAAYNIYDLWKDSSLNFEKYADHYSMRLSRQYRLEMEIKWLDKGKTVGVFYINKISSHYGD